jgi:hypothetical protein
MTAALHVSDAPHDITGIAIRVGGATKTVTEGWIRVDGALKQFYSVLAVALSKYLAIGRANSATIITVTSEPITATATGTIGDVAYSWTRTAPDSQPWTINSPTAQTTTFSTDCDQGEEFTATFICTITDRAGQVLASTPVTVNNANIFYGGGYAGSGATPGQAYP